MKSLLKGVSITILIAISLAKPNTISGERPFDLEKRTLFSGVWQSQNKALYECDGDKMVCSKIPPKIYERFKGWRGKIRIRNIRKKNDKWIADQALRKPPDGEIIRWIEVVLVVNGNKLIEYLPEDPLLTIREFRFIKVDP